MSLKLTTLTAVYRAKVFVTGRLRDVCLAVVIVAYPRIRSAGGSTAS
jgi:hypothetical protein